MLVVDHQQHGCAYLSGWISRLALALRERNASIIQ
jgi:hypothetical protein